MIFVLKPELTSWRCWIVERWTYLDELVSVTLSVDIYILFILITSSVRILTAHKRVVWILDLLSFVSASIMSILWCSENQWRNFRNSQLNPSLSIQDYENNTFSMFFQIHSTESARTSWWHQEVNCPADFWHFRPAAKFSSKIDLIKEYDICRLRIEVQKISED